MANQKYDWGWVSRFSDGTEYEYGEGYASRAAVIQDLHKMRAEEKESLKSGYQTKETVVKYSIRRRPAVVLPDWEEVPG